MKYFQVLFILLISILSCTPTQLPLCDANHQNLKYPIIAHSHNDYDQSLPITNARRHGFTSLEVDIVFDGTDLKVSHDDDNLKDKPLFEELYLKPIIEEVLTDSLCIILLVDIKNYSEVLLESLNQTLEKQSSDLVSREAPHNNFNKIKVILSGDFPRDEIIQDNTNRYLFIDGRMTDFDLNASSDLTPLISMDFSELSGWNGKYNPNAETLETISQTIDLVHSHGKMIRFWNTADREPIWLNLIELGADVIGVDDIDKFCAVMKKNGLLE